MPGLIEAATFIILSAQAGALGTGLLAVGSAYSGLLLGAASIGVSYLAQALMPRPQAPKPEDVQVTVKSPTAPRIRHYGRVKTSGTLIFIESKSGDLHKVIALGTGQLDAIEEVWIDDNLAVIDGSGDVTSEPYFLNGSSRVHIETRLGIPTETHYASLEAVFPEWDSDHVGNGVSTLYAQQKAVGSSRFAEVFPNGVNTLYRVVARGSLVYNPATETTAWSDNAADIIRDYMTHPDGMRLPSAMVNTPLAAAGWLAAHNKCAEAVPLKAGGTVERYKIWGSYRFDERPGDVLARMLDACDGRILPTPDGGFTLDVGDWIEPEVVLDATSIAGFSDLTRGRNVLETANVVRSTFMSPQHDYQLTDADQWIDEEDVSQRGEYVHDAGLSMIPNHSQARRLMKLTAYRDNPDWIVTLQCNMKGLAAFGERFVRVTYPLFGIDEVFEVEDFRFNFGEGNILTGCNIRMRSMPAEAYEWDAATEEGTEPISEEVVVDNTIPVPANFTFTEGTVTVAGEPYSVGIIGFDAPPSDSLTVEGRFKKTSESDTEWEVIPIEEDATSAKTGILEDGVEYEAQVRHVTITGRVGEWTASELLTPISDPVAPLALSSFGVTGDQMGHSDLAISTAGGDTHLSRIAIYRVPAGEVLDKVADFAFRIAAAPGTSFGYVDGDATVTNLALNPNFDADTDWTKEANWTIAAGVATKVAGASNRFLYQSVSPPSISSRYRWQMVISGWTAGNFFYRITNNTTAIEADGPFAANGTFRGTLQNGGAGANRHGIFGAAAAAGNIDSVIFYLETTACAPQGVWDYYAIPENVSGIEGPQSLVSSVTIV